jgi:phosphoglycolate phosphatase
MMADRRNGLNNIKAVLFDLDGTLLNTLDDIADNANYALGVFGYPSFPVDAYRYFVGRGVDNLMKNILPYDARTPSNIESIKKVYVEWYNKHSFDKTRPYDGVVETVCELKLIPLKLAVVSNKPDADSKFAVSHVFDPGLFDIVAGGKSEIPLKPDPAIVHNILGEFGVASEDAVLVGDTIVDLSTARNAGCMSIGVKWGFRPEEVSFAGAGADFVIDRPHELLDLIRTR